MRAVAIEGFGGVERLQLMDLRTPEPGAGDVRIQVRGSGVNQVDAQIRRGELVRAVPHEFPVIPGWEAAGTVDMVGEGVDGLAAGDAVFAHCRKRVVHGGTYAEYVTVPARQVAAAPRALDATTAAAVPLAGLTAYQSLFVAAGLGAGETVLVSAAAGGVGSFATQLAADRGAVVIGTASEGNHDLVRGLGATHVIDYHDHAVSEHVLDLAPTGVDVLLDLVGGDSLHEAASAVRDGGRLVSVVEEPTGELLGQRGIRPHYVSVEPDGEQLRELAEAIDSGRLRVHLHEVLPLERAARAHELIEEGHVHGKVALAL